MKIAILGTRGIPNHHGGFEQFAEYFSVFMVDKGHEVYVYNSDSHPFREKEYKGVKILHKKDPEHSIGTVGQFIYDLNCIMDSRKRNFDIILQLGYTSSSIWGWLLPKKSLIITNMDGLEWKRSKYSKYVRSFLKLAEKLAVQTSDFLISDSQGIRDYIKQKYNQESEFIAYGANIFNNPDKSILIQYNVIIHEYNMLIARLEPENNIEIILDGVVLSKHNTTFLVVGKHETAYGEFLKKKYLKHNNIKFVGGIYNKEHLDNLRYYSNLYFHGHSVGGTNPSLLEAMASNALIIANDNIFNKSILEKDAFYFKTKENITALLKKNKKSFKDIMVKNHSKIETQYSWHKINSAYERFLMNCLLNKQFRKD